MRSQKEIPGPVGLVGLGLMGRGIASCLLAHGFEVLAYNRTARRGKASLDHLGESREERARRKLTPRSRVRNWQDRFRLVRSPADLAPCAFVIESVKEDLELKRQIFAELESALGGDAVIA